MIKFSHKGDFSKLTRYFKRADNAAKSVNLEQYGQKGVALLSAATPVDTGLAASSWFYKITKNNGRTTISFHNSNKENGVLIAIILQYGHATRNGGWVEGRDYINPAIQPLFDEIANNAWKEVTRL